MVLEITQNFLFWSLFIELYSGSQPCNHTAEDNMLFFFFKCKVTFQRDSWLHLKTQLHSYPLQGAHVTLQDGGACVQGAQSPSGAWSRGPRSLKPFHEPHGQPGIPQLHTPDCIRRQSS